MAVLVWDDLLRFFGPFCECHERFKAVKRVRSSLGARRFPFIVPELMVIFGKGLFDRGSCVSSNGSARGCLQQCLVID